MLKSIISKRLAKILLASTSLFVISACGGKTSSEPTPQKDIAEEAPSEKSETTPTSNTETPSPEATENLKKSKAFLAENALKKETNVLPSGLQYEILVEGPETGATPVLGDLIKLHYTGTLIDGTVFDSSRERGETVSFPFEQGLIPGWLEGIPLMSAGDRFKFAIPSNLAYGETGTPGGPIGPNQALIFDVELFEVTDGETYRAELAAIREAQRLEFEKTANANLEASLAFLAENGNKEGIITTESGLQYKIISEGPKDGKSPSAVDNVEVHYAGTLRNGVEFDSSYKRGEPISFNLSGVIPGWTEGLQLMSTGDKFQFFIPPELGYRERGTPGGPIGPNEALIFEVELLDVK